MHSAAEVPVPSVPCIRSHDLTFFERSTCKGLSVSSPVRDCLVKSEEGTPDIEKLVKNMPVLLRDATSNYLRLLAPPDVDLTTVPTDCSWFSDVVLTFMDRNGSVIFHEANFSPNSSLTEGISNFVDTRWGDYVHNEDLDVWNQHLNEAFSEADRWRANHLSASDALAKSEFDIDGRTGDRRRVCSGANQQVSTTSKLSPEGSDTMRHFVLSSVYRAKWGARFYYFRSLSLPFLRNQPELPLESCVTNDTSESGSLLMNIGLDANTLSSTKAASQPDIPTHSALHFSQESCDVGVFSPTSSFENLLLLNYHCIIGKCTGESESQHLVPVAAPPYNSTLSPSMTEKPLKQLRVASDDPLLSSREFASSYPQYEDDNIQSSAASLTGSLRSPSSNFPSPAVSAVQALHPPDVPVASADSSDQPAHQRQQSRECKLCVPDTSVPTTSRSDATGVLSYAPTAAEAKHVIHYRAGSQPFSSKASANPVLFRAPNSDPSVESRRMAAYPVSKDQRYQPVPDVDSTPFGTSHSSSPVLATSPSRSTHMNYTQPHRVAGSTESSVYFPEGRLEEQHGHHRQHHTQQHQGSVSSSNSLSNRTSAHQTSASSQQIPPVKDEWLEQASSPNQSHVSPSSGSASAPFRENVTPKPAIPSLLKTVPDPLPQSSFRPRAATDLSQCSIKGALARLGNQTDRVSLVVSLLPPEVIDQIRRACENSTGCSGGETRASSDSATPNSTATHPSDTETIAHRVHAILVRYLGPGSLARFFQSTTSEASPLLPRGPHSASSCLYRSPTESTPVIAKSTMSCPASSCSSTPSLVSTTRIFKNAPQSRSQPRQSLVSEVTLNPQCTEVCETAPLTSAGRPSTKESTPICLSNTNQPLSCSVPPSQRSSPGTSTNLNPSYTHANLQQSSAALTKRQSISSYDLCSISSATSTGSNSGVLESLLSGYVDCRRTSPTSRGSSSITMRHRNASEACATKQEYGSCFGWPSPPASGRSSTASLLTPKTPNMQPYNSSSSIKSLVFDFNSEPHSPYAESSTLMTTASVSYHSGDGTVHNLSGSSPLDQELTTPSSSPSVCGPGRSSLLVRLLHNDLADPPPPSSQLSASKNGLIPSSRSSLAHLLLHGVPPVASMASSKAVTGSPDLPIRGTSVNSIGKSESHAPSKSSSPVNSFGQQSASSSYRDQLQRAPYAEHTQSPVCAKYVAAPPLPEYGASTTLVNNPLTRPLTVNPTTTLSSPLPRVEGLETTPKNENNGGALSSSLYRLLLDSTPCPETIQAEVESATAQGFVTAPPTPAYPMFPLTSSAGRAPPTEDSFRLRGDDDLWDLLDDPLMSSFLMDGDASRPKSLDPPAKMFPEALTLAATAAASFKSDEGVRLAPAPVPDSFSADAPLTKRARYSSDSAACDFAAQPRAFDPSKQRLSPQQQQTLLSPCLQMESTSTSSLNSPESRQQPDVLKHVSQNQPPPRSGNGLASPSNYTPPSTATIERNRTAAAAAAAKIAQEAANQQRNSGTQWRLAEERKRLLRLQKNCLLMNSGRAGNHSLPTQSPLSASGSGGFDQLAYQLPGAAVSSGPLPLDDFTRKLKEIAPNVNVQKTPAINCPSFFLEDPLTQLPQSKFHDSVCHLTSASCKLSDPYRGCGGDTMSNRPPSASQYDFTSEPLVYSPRGSPVSGGQSQTLPQSGLLKPPPADARHLPGGGDGGLLPRHEPSCHPAVTRPYAAPPAYPSTALSLDDSRANQDPSLLRRATRMSQASVGNQLGQYEVKTDPHVSAVSAAAAAAVAAVVTAPNNRHNMVKAELRMIVTNRCQISAEASSQFRNDPSSMTNKIRNIKTAAGICGVDSRTNGSAGGGLVVHSPKQHGPNTTGLQRGGAGRSNDQHPFYRPRMPSAQSMIDPDIQSVPPPPPHPSDQHYPQGCASGLGSDATASPVVSPYAFDASPTVSDDQGPYHSGSAPFPSNYDTSPPHHLQQQQQHSGQVMVSRCSHQSVHASHSDLMPRPRYEESCLREGYSPQMSAPTFHPPSALSPVLSQSMKNGPLLSGPQLNSSQAIPLGGCGGQSARPLPPTNSGFSDHTSLLGSALSNDIDDVVLPEDIVNDVFELEKLSRLT
uniref:Uncharacterized protein n=1 Tax=Schistocephalus solidus TaxID=70667 RepID=A0A0X3PSZ7_SCHSO